VRSEAKPRVSNDAPEGLRRPGGHWNVLRGRFAPPQDEKQRGYSASARLAANATFGTRNSAAATMRAIANIDAKVR
jgi:hypothetical protein